MQSFSTQFGARDIVRASAGTHRDVLNRDMDPHYGYGGSYYLGKPDENAVKYRVVGRLPHDHKGLRSWLDKFIEKDAVIYMGFHQMFEQVPNKPPYNHDPTGKPQVRDYKLMLKLFNHIISTAPAFEDHEFVGFPINAILDWPMGTPAGMAMFSRPDVNIHFHKMFDVWTTFLDSKESTAVLNSGATGWFGLRASKAMPHFVETYVCDPSLPHYGFKSWNDFFTRRFRDGVRPVIYHHDDNYISSACESTVYRIAHQVQKTDSFWVKGQSYSLDHMLGFDEDASHFVGGTVYQAFLPVTAYHGWHAPVSGRVQRVTVIPGTYYAESPSEGFPDPDSDASNASQAFLTAVAARTIIYIEADNPKIGLMCFMGVGMAEVSTCMATVKAGDIIRKGDNIGTFRYGGSTHCLIFRPETKVKFSPDIDHHADVKLNVAIAHV
ncbi:hypothetical protein FKP32DRAFT_646186 [Trametes sanguinea]|nr:hypothetical protein FKP32DRAFT_646186 [Trametes sanguinea]